MPTVAPPTVLVSATHAGVVLEVVVADLTKLEVEAIVNAANTSLLGGGGVDGAIHRAAGKELLAECETLGGCKTGGAKITRGYRLPARYVIHAVGPVWSGGNHGEKELLGSCYRNALGLAEEYGLNSIAFPAISTGVYRFPTDLAAGIAVGTVKSEIDFGLAGISRVLFCCFSDQAVQPYRDALAEAGLILGGVDGLSR